MSISPTIAVCDNATHAVAYAQVGYAVFPLKPGEKSPATKDGFYSATTDVETVGAMWAANPTAGIGLVPMLSGGLLVVDADTADGAELMRRWFGEPTVLTAGHAAGKHQGGAHWWLWLDEGVTLPEGVSIASAKRFGLDLIGAGSGGAYVVAPPTTLKGYGGRAYETVGDSYDVSEGHPFLVWLAEVVEQQKAEQEEKRQAAASRRAAHAVTGYPNLDEWQQDVLWSDLLADDHWTDTGDTDRCGCPLWTHPWGASTPRSATAHETGCAASRSGENGVLHAWSTTVAERFEGQHSITKYRYITVERYDGDYAACREAEGIPHEDDFTGGSSFDPSDIEVMVSSARWPFGQAGGNASGLGLTEEQVVADAAWTESWIKGEFDAIVAPLAQVPEPQRWIYTAAEAARAGYHTPRVKKDDGTEDKFDPWDREAFPLGHPAAPDLLKAIFDLNDFTRAVLKNARAFNPHPTGPMPLLITELIRGGMRWPTEIGAGPGTPLSISTLRVGLSGKGKSLSMKRTKWTTLPGLDSVAERVNSTIAEAMANGINSAINWDSHRSVGSGEKMPDLLTDTFEEPRESGKGTRTWKEQKKHAVAWVEEGEFRATLKRGGRDTSTIFDAYNALWAGENPLADTRTHGWTELYDFFVFLSGGMQPQVWLALLGETTGFLQRTLLTGVSDPWILTGDVLAADPPAGWTAPLLPTPGENGHPSEFVLCPAIHAAVARNAELASVEHTEADDAWESHLIQVRLRVACLSALRFGTMVVSEDIWEWTGYIIEHHRRVRAWLLAMSETAKDEEDKQTGTRRAQVFAAEKAARRERVESVMDTILGHLAEAGGESTRNRAKRSAGRKASAYADAESALVKAGKVELLPVQGLSVPIRLLT